jgi:hypothetical protein
MQRSRTARGLRAFAAGFAILILCVVSAWTQSPVTINLATTTSPTVGQPGVTVLTLTCSSSVGNDRACQSERDLAGGARQYWA